MPIQDPGPLDLNHSQPLVVLRLRVEPPFVSFEIQGNVAQLTEQEARQVAAWLRVALTT